MSSQFNISVYVNNTNGTVQASIGPDNFRQNIHCAYTDDFKYIFWPQIEYPPPSA